MSLCLFLFSRGVLQLKTSISPLRSRSSDENNIHCMVVHGFHKDSSFLVHKIHQREDSQIDFATGNIFIEWGFYTITILTFQQQFIFQADKLPENLVNKEESYSEHKFRPNKSCKLGQTWHRQRHSCDCQPALFANYRPDGLALGSILCVFHNSK